MDAWPGTAGTPSGWPPAPSEAGSTQHFVYMSSRKGAPALGLGVTGPPGDHTRKRRERVALPQAEPSRAERAARRPWAVCSTSTVCCALRDVTDGRLFVVSDGGDKADVGVALLPGRPCRAAIDTQCAIGCDRDGREQTLREYISVLAELGEPGIPYAQCDLGRVTSRDEASGGTSHDRPVEGPSGRAKRLRSSRVLVWLW